MGSYLFRRLLNLIPILIGISFLSFVLINLSPSDPAEVAVRVNEVTPTEEVLAETRAKLGLDKPFLTRYVAWLNNSLHGDFGNRYVDDKPVMGISAIVMWTTNPYLVKSKRRCPRPSFLPERLCA